MARQDVELKFSLIDGVSRNLGEIQKGVTGLGASLVKINATADLTGKAFGAIKASGDFLANQITSAGDFEDSLASLQAVTGASAEELGRLKDAAIAASQASIFSSTQAADGLTELARAGFGATEAISALNPVLALAQGQQLDVAESAQFVATTLTQFGLAAGEAGRVADVLASTADKSSVDVRQLGLSLSYAAPIAKQLGIGLEETTAIIGKLADEGFRGERGGTALANVFTALIDPSSKFSKALDDAGIKTRDFGEVMEALKNKGEGAGKILLALDTTARPAITALASKGSAGLRELNKELDNSTGAAQRTADIMGGTFNSVVQKFQNNIENLRNAVLLPILEPLGDEITRLSERLIAFSQSPEFDAIVANFTRIATDGIRGFGDALAEVDFTAAIGKIVDFSTTLAENLGVIASAVDVTARIIGGFGDVVAITFQSIKGVTADAAAALIEPLAVFDEGAKGVWLSLKAQAADSEKSVGASLSKLGDRFGIVGDSAASAGRSVGSAADSFKAAAQSYRELASSMVPAPLLAVADAALAAAREIEGLRVPPEAAKISLGNLAQGADSASLSLNALELRLRTVREALANAPQGSPEFIRFAQDAAKLEEQIRLAKEAIDEASGANDRLAGSSDRASNSLRNQANAARDAADGANEASRSNSQVSDSFGNIDRQSSSVAVSLGNMSEAYARLAIEAAGAAKSEDEYRAIWNSYVQRFEDEEEQLRNAIELRRRQNAELNEEDRIRQRIINQYGESSTLVEVLVQEELRLAQSRREANQEAERGIEIEQRRRGQAGGIGTAGTAADTAPGASADTAPGASAGRGTVAGAARNDSPINITINQNGATPETIRDLAPLIERELGRLGSLRR